MTSYYVVIGQARFRLRHLNHVVWHALSVMPTGRPSVVAILSWVFTAGFLGLGCHVVKRGSGGLFRLALSCKQKPQRVG